MTESQLLPLAVLAILACAPQFGCGSERSAGGATGGLGAAGGLLGAAGGCLDPDATWSIDSFVSGIDFAP